MTSLTYGSVCSGIESATVAWHPLGMRAAWFSEIEAYPCSVLKHHYPAVPNLGDMRKIARAILVGEAAAPDVLVGGTPCQAFSLAGLREALEDERGQLTLTYMRLLNAIDFIRGRNNQQPCIAVWENVKGVLNAPGNAFGCFLAGLAGEDVPLVPAGKKWPNAGCVFGPKRAVAWRVMDAQYFNLAQQRQRVFVVASARKGFDPSAVLFEFDGVRRDSAPRREPGTYVAALTANGVGTCGADDNQAQAGHLIATDEVSHCLNAGGMGRIDYETETFVTECVTGDVTHTLKGEGFDASEDGTGRGQPIIAQAVADTLTASWYQSNGATVGNNPGIINAIIHGLRVRRLMPIECERLMGFSDNYTLVPHRGKPAADGPRYKALGNSMAVPCMSWIGTRINQYLNNELGRGFL
jgi:DNA (cytosine-5)-methyltransferase 1